MATKKNTKNIYILLSLIILMINLGLVYYFKHLNSQLSASDFQLFTFGNIIYGIFTFLILFGLLLNKNRVIANSSKAFNNIFFLLFLMMLNVVGIIFLVKSEPAITHFTIENITLRIALLVISFLLHIFLIYFISAYMITISFFKKKIFKHSFLTALVLFLLTFGYSFIKAITFTGTTENEIVSKKYEVVVVLGASVRGTATPSPVFRSRIDKAYDLYKKGRTEKIQLTGGKAWGTMIESIVALNYLLKKQIIIDDILLEDQTTDTIEQMQFVRNELIDKQKFSNIAIISDKFHLNRISEICKFYNLKVDFIASGHRLNFIESLYFFARDSFALTLFWFFAY